MTMLITAPLRRRPERGREATAVLVLRLARRLLGRLAPPAKPDRQDPFILWRPLLD